jgi:hypothetical protein
MKMDTNTMYVLAALSVVVGVVMFLRRHRITPVGFIAVALALAVSDPRSIWVVWATVAAFVLVLAVFAVVGFATPSEAGRGNG